MDNEEAFIKLVQIAKEDKSTREALLGIVKQSDFHRISLINTFLERAKIKGAPKEFTSVLSMLKDGSLAKKVADFFVDD